MFFLQMMTQHYCLNSRWFNIRCLSNRQLSNSNRWLKENHDWRKTPRNFANMSTCLDTSYTPVLVLSIGFPSLKPSPQLARLFVSVWWCLGCPCCNFSCCGSNRWCRSCCNRHQVFSLPQMYPTTLRLKTGLWRNMTKILPKGSQKKKLGRSFSHRWGYTNK